MSLVFLARYLFLAALLLVGALFAWAAWRDGPR